MTLAAPPGPAAPRPPSLDPTRPNPQGRPVGTGEQTRIPRSTANAQRRHLVAIGADRLRSLEAAGVTEGDELHDLWRKLHDGWSSCGWSSLYRNRATGTVVGLPDHCDKPLCPYDEQRRVGRLRDRYRPRADAALAEGRLWFAVLTVPNVPLGERAATHEVIRRALGKLRRRSWWTEAVVGGIWRLEDTVNLTTSTWHPHLNLLFETHAPIRMAEWQPLIQAEWRSVLGREAEQWIWLEPGWSGAVPETIKRQVAARRDVELRDDDVSSALDYSVKAPKLEWVDASRPEWVVEYVEGSRNRRSVSSFGAWRKLPKPPRSERDEPTVPAPYAPGFDDEWAPPRRLPLHDPLLPLGSTPATWEFVGRGPRWTLRPVKPPEEGRSEWLVWSPGDGQDPTTADDDLAFTYQPAWSVLARAGPS